MAPSTSARRGAAATRQTKKRSSLRLFLPAFVVGYFAKRRLKPTLLPYGPAVHVPVEDRHVYAPIDYDNDSLRFKYGKLQKIFERLEDGKEPLLKGPETVVVDKHGTVYVVTEDAKLVKLSDFENTSEYEMTAKTTVVLDLGVGRPLGGKITQDGKTLYVADAVLGLIRVKDFAKKGSKVELLASRVQDENGSWSQILLADDIDIGPKTGMIYFSDATNVAPDRIGTEDWDVLYASKTEYARGNRTGRLLQYNPKTNQVSILASDIWFANGIAVDKDETFVMVSETFAGRTLKYHLQGDKKGTIETMADEFPGYPDGADCSFDSGLCYVPLFASYDKTFAMLDKLPHPWDMWLRTIIMTLPKNMAPDPKPYGAIVEMNPSLGKISRILQDPNGQDIGFLTGVTLHDGKIYLGSLRNSFVGLYDLSPSVTATA